MAIQIAANSNPETENDRSADVPENAAPVLAPQPAGQALPLADDAPSAAPASFEAFEGEAALQVVIPELKAIRLSEVRRINVTPPSMVSAGLIYAGNFAEDRPKFEAKFTKEGFDTAAYADLRERAVAYWHLCIIARQNPDIALKSLLAEAKPLRAKLVRAATYLWGEDAALGGVVGGIRNGHAYLNQADDLGALATLFADNWTHAEGRCDVTKDDVVRAGTLGAKFLEGVGRTRMDEFNETKALRLQAGEYLLRGIDAVRRAAAFVFADDEQGLSRYPNLSVMRIRRPGKETEVFDDVDTEDVIDELPETAIPAPQPTAE